MRKKFAASIFSIYKRYRQGRRYWGGMGGEPPPPTVRPVDKIGAEGADFFGQLTKSAPKARIFSLTDITELTKPTKSQATLLTGRSELAKPHLSTDQKL